MKYVDWTTNLVSLYDKKTCKLFTTPLNYMFKINIFVTKTLHHDIVLRKTNRSTWCQFLSHKWKFQYESSCSLSFAIRYLYRRLWTTNDMSQECMYERILSLPLRIYYYGSHISILLSYGNNANAKWSTICNWAFKSNFPSFIVIIIIITIDLVVYLTIHHKELLKICQFWMPNRI